MSVSRMILATATATMPNGPKLTGYYRALYYMATPNIVDAIKLNKKAELRPEVAQAAPQGTSHVRGLGPFGDKTKLCSDSW